MLAQLLTMYSLRRLNRVFLKQLVKGKHKKCECYCGGYLIMFIIEAFVLSDSEIVVSMHCNNIDMPQGVGMANFLQVWLRSVKLALAIVVPPFQNTT